MKPVVIVTIFVVCSVVAVFGILLGYDAYLQKAAQDRIVMAQQFDRDVTLLTQSYHEPAKKCFVQHDDYGEIERRLQGIFRITNG